MEQQEEKPFSRQSQLNLSFIRYKLLLLLKNRKILELEYENPVHFAEHRLDTTVLTAARTAGAVAVCKANPRTLSIGYDTTARIFALIKKHFS